MLHAFQYRPLVVIVDLLSLRDHNSTCVVFVHHGPILIEDFRAWVTDKPLVLRRLIGDVVVGRNRGLDAPAGTHWLVPALRCWRAVARVVIIL